MKETERGKEIIKEKEILVCNAISIWRNSSDSKPEKSIYTSGLGDRGDCFSFTSSMKSIAEDLVGQYPELTKNNQQTRLKVVYEPLVDHVLYLSDGYFGRKAVPSELIIFKPLSLKQIEALEKNLAKLKIN